MLHMWNGEALQEGMPQLEKEWEVPFMAFDED
jgi:hypothetical protein